MAEKVIKMSQQTIKRQLESIAGLSAYFNTLKSKTKNDNVNLSLGDQLRPTKDYNGSLFEVVREPYWCWTDERGRAKEIITQYHFKLFNCHHLAENFVDELEDNEVDKEGMDDGNFDIQLLPLGHIQGGTPQYQVDWKSRTKPLGYKLEKRIWLRKICMISKAEGQSDDKNHRSLSFSVKTMPFSQLIQNECHKLSKISRSLELTDADAKRTRKVSLRKQNQEKLAELWKLWGHPENKYYAVSGFYSEKYGLFLKSDIKYEITTTLINPQTALINSVKEIRENVKDVVKKKSNVITEIKSKSE